MGRKIPIRKQKSKTPAARHGFQARRELDYYKVSPSNKRHAVATSLKINETLKSRVQHLASQRRRSPHWIMLEAIQQYVEREEARESFRQEALASWAAYQETGRHLTGQEVREWLNGWGTDDGKAMPKCHG
jgi:predicted transcriptional regulator